MRLLASRPQRRETGESQESEGVGRLIVGYCRVSTAKQRIAGASDRQRERVEEYIRATYPGERFIVLAEQASGTNCDRKKLGKLIDLALSSRVAKCVVEWPDRLSRGSYGIISRLLEKCGVEIVVTRTGEKENDAKTVEEEVLHDALCAIYCVQARAHGKRAGLKITMVPPAGFKERVAQLRGAGLGREDIVDTIAAEGWKCQNTGKPLKLRSVRLVLDELHENGPVVPTCIQSFVKRRCVVAFNKKERSARLYEAYVDHCRTCKKSALGRAKWTELIKLACPRVQFKNGAEFTIAEGIALA